MSLDFGQNFNLFAKHANNGTTSASGNSGNSASPITTPPAGVENIFTTNSGNTGSLIAAIQTANGFTASGPSGVYVPDKSGVQGTEGEVKGFAQNILNLGNANPISIDQNAFIPANTDTGIVTASKVDWSSFPTVSPS